MMKENAEKNNNIKQNLLKNVSKELPNIAEGITKDMEKEENKKSNNNDEVENKMNKIKSMLQTKKETDFQKRIKFGMCFFVDIYHIFYNVGRI